MSGQRADTGAGIAREPGAHLRSRSSPLRAANKGTGLGLSVILRIVARACGISLCIARRAGGTQFLLTFPVAAQAFGIIRAARTDRREWPVPAVAVTSPQSTVRRRSPVCSGRITGSSDSSYSKWPHTVATLSS